tara:strand:+ start:5731 stop:5877 length:147 start_codon:yes stop_codon:yes gene_type:complete
MGTCIECIAEEIRSSGRSEVVLVKPNGTMTLIKEEGGRWRAVESAEDE